MKWRVQLFTAFWIGLGALTLRAADETLPLRRAGAGVECATLKNGRTVFEGTITEVTLARPRIGRKLQGLVRVQGSENSQKLFRVQAFTLILVRHRNGRLRIGRLQDLDRGWACSVTFDLQDDPDGGNDDKHAGEAVDAEHLIAQVP